MDYQVQQEFNNAFISISAQSDTCMSFNKASEATAVKNKFLTYFTEVQSENKNTQYIPINQRNQHNEDEMTALLQPATYTEVKEIFKKIKSNSAPGRDGITNKFYKFYSKIFIPIFVRLFNLCLTGSSIPLDMKTGTVRLIYKKKGDISEPKNWRPITLLNSDFKIIGRLCFARLSHMAHKMTF